jgi:hypothetical protein
MRALLVPGRHEYSCSPSCHRRARNGVRGRSAGSAGEVMDRILAGRSHGLADVSVMNLVPGLQDVPLERMPSRLRMSLPPGDLDGHPAPALGLHHGVTLTFGAGAAEPPPAANRGVYLLICHLGRPAVEVTGQERKILVGLVLRRSRQMNLKHAPPSRGQAPQRIRLSSARQSCAK